MITLPIIYTGERQPELDIISIPGLPTLYPQYKLKDHHQWLREVLSHQVPQARIMAFQYDFAKDSSDTSWRSLVRHAENLLYSIVHRREEVPDRPIIFVCYSFGAFILKKALLIAKENNTFRNIFDKTGSIIFLACLHDEGYPGFEDVCLKCAAVEFGTKKSHDAVESLRKAEDWNIIKDVMESFRSLRCAFPVRILYELNSTNLLDRSYSFKGRKPECLCSELISSLGWDNAQLIGVKKDHGELTMYPHRGDDQGFFETFMRTISEVVNIVCPPVLRPVWSTTGSSEDVASWTIIPELARMTSGLSIESGPEGYHRFLPGYGSRSNASAQNMRLPCCVMSPYEINPDFVGRTKELAQIHNSLDPAADTSKQRVIVVVGLGGMGKTQVALSYGFQHKDVYEVVLWADADGQAKLSESFILFAKELGLGDNLTSIHAKQAVKECLQNLDVNFLMIMDNADGDDKNELLKEFWPGTNPKGSILITSRDQTLLAQFDGLELMELDEKSAVDLLLNLTTQKRFRMSEQAIQEEHSAAKKIVENIGYLPLGISQAAGLIVNESYSLIEFLEAYDASDIIEDCEDVHLIRRGGTYRYSLRTVWNMNFERLLDDQQSLIKLMSFLDPDRFQVTMLKDGAAKSKDRGLAFMDTSRKFAKCKSGLLRSTLVSQSVDGKELRMHRLVQASCQLRMSLAEQRASFSSGVKLIRAVWPVPERNALHNPSLWDGQRALLPHVQKLCEFYVHSLEKNEPLIDQNDVNWDFASLLYEAGWFCYESGMLESVFSLLYPAEQYCLPRLDKGGGYRILADIYGGLGSFGTESNQFQAAYDDFSKQWKYLQLAFETGELQRPSIWEVFGLGRLGNGLHGLHRYKEAESYYRQCLNAWKGLPGDQKIFTTHLATCLWLQGRPDEGEMVVRAVIKDMNDTTNFRTAMAMYALGNIQIAQSQNFTENGDNDLADAKLAEAMSIHAKVWKLWTFTLGARHHKTADAMHKLGWHFHRIKEYAQAVEYLEKALEIYTCQPTIFKNEIARTKYKLGCVYQDMASVEKGTEFIRAAEQLRQEIVPPEMWEPAQGENDFDEIVQFWTR